LVTFSASSFCFFILSCNSRSASSFKFLFPSFISSYGFLGFLLFTGLGLFFVSSGCGGAGAGSTGAGGAVGCGVGSVAFCIFS
jgi:hypothetical protein